MKQARLLRKKVIVILYWFNSKHSKNNMYGIPIKLNKPYYHTQTLITVSTQLLHIKTYGIFLLENLNTYLIPT